MGRYWGFLKDVSGLHKERSRRNASYEVLGWKPGEIWGAAAQMGRKGQVWDISEDRMRELQQMMIVDSDIEIMPMSGDCV